MEVLSGTLTYMQAARQYAIVSDQTVRDWVNDYRKTHLGFNFEGMASKKNPPSKFSEQPSPEYKKQNEVLIKALELAKLENLALQTMIDIAESELKIDIRKKSGTKQ